MLERLLPRRRRGIAAATVALLACAGLTLSTAGPAEAAPLIGRPFLSVLLCQDPSTPTLPRTPDQVRSLLLGPTSPNVEQWFAATSQRHATLAGVTVSRWYTLPAEPSGAGDPNATLRTVCLQTAQRSGYIPPVGGQVLVATNRPVCHSYYCFAPAVFAGDGVQAWAEAILRTYGMDQAGSTDTPTATLAPKAIFTRRDDEWSALGLNGRTLGPSGSHLVPTGLEPGERGLNAYELDRLSWLDDRVAVTAGADGRTYTRFTLAPLDQKPGLTFTGVQLIRVPYRETKTCSGLSCTVDPNRAYDPRFYFTVEFRAPYGDPGATNARILIHDVRAGTPSLLRDWTLPVTTVNGVQTDTGQAPVSSLRANGVTITWLGRVGNQMIVDVVTPVTGANPDPKACAAGYVWRGIDHYDHVCVTPARKAAVDSETLWGFLCVPGITVARQALPTDQACVTPTARAESAADNRDAPNHLADPNA
jgi:hypothetical protein